MNIVIPDSYKKAVQGGYWNIEDMDTTTDFGKGLAEAIQKYQDYYDKAKNCTQEAQNLYNEQASLNRCCLVFSFVIIFKILLDIAPKQARFKEVAPAIDKSFHVFWKYGIIN